ncbi:MAG TPA: type 4a pilus biogenesis protein PilO [Actinomycetes bacterium]
MTRTRQWTVGTALLVVLMLVAGWFLLISPKRSEAADLQTQTTAQMAQNASLQNQIAVLQSQAKNLPAQQAELAAIRQHLPDNPALPGLVRSLTDAAAKSGVTLVSLAPSTPAAAPAPKTTAPSGTSATAPATGTGQSAAAAAAAGATLQMVPIVVTVTGSYYDTEQFLNKVEGLTRSFLVTGFSVTPAESQASSGASTGDLTTAIQGRVFYTPAAAAAPTTATAQQ